MFNNKITSNKISTNYCLVKLHFQLCFSYQDALSLLRELLRKKAELVGKLSVMQLAQLSCYALHGLFNSSQGYSPVKCCCEV